MASPSSSLSSLTPSELDSVSINIPHLIIASILYPDLLHPRHLTPDHIAAIHINTSPSSSTARPDGAAIVVEANNSIRFALAYDEYISNLTPEPRIAQCSGEDFKVLGWELSEGMDYEEFLDHVDTSIFIRSLEHEGDDAPRTVLEEGWTAFVQVPEALKRGLGLVDGREGQVNGVNGIL